MKSILVLISLILPAICLAAGGEHGGGHGHLGPSRTEIYQLINVVILLGGVIYFVKDQAIEFFKNRRTDYLAAAEKSASARRQAEADFAEIKNKIDKIDATRAEMIAKAQAHAADVKKQIIEESEAVAKRIKDDAELAARVESQKAERDLRQQLIKDSITAARSVLSKDISAGDHQKLQGDFVRGVGVEA